MSFLLKELEVLRCKSLHACQKIIHALNVSSFGLQLAAAAGAIVIATSSSDKKLQQAKELGAKHVINYKTTPEWETEVLKLAS